MKFRQSGQSLVEYALLIAIVVVVVIVAIVVPIIVLLMMICHLDLLPAIGVYLLVTVPLGIIFQLAKFARRKMRPAKEATDDSQHTS